MNSKNKVQVNPKSKERGSNGRPEPLKRTMVREPSRMALS
jgi:hypothetical protein